ncbi:MAG: protease HtpX [Gammaproteobacteria bacterium]|nr:MAG: protease HtpX [Gammaproteobacteria bacterium]RTZ74204.1 MAG: protease HtpX [Gammaproteobacteria bacterium]
MLRILLFLGTNVAILAMLSVTMRILGVDRVLEESGGLNLNALLIMSAVVGFAGSFISLFISKWMAKSSMGVQIIDQPANPTERWLLDTVKKLADEAGVGMPEVGIFPSPSPNAFATGWNRNDSLVAVSAGLLQNMNADEVEAVLGHEISHVANGDMVTLTLIQGVVNTFVFFLSRIIGHVVDRAVFGNREGYGPGYFITSLVAQFILGILAMMIVAWFSRWREFRADAGSAMLTGREKMIAALRRLQQAEPEPLPDEMAAFGIAGKGLHELFASHPPLEKRIEALQQMT